MSFYALIYPISQNRLFIKRFPRVRLATALVLSFTLIALFLGCYVFQINQMAKSDYLVENYEKTMSALSQGNKNLEINFALVNGLGNIENLVSNLNFEKAGEVDYIRVIESTVAAR